MDKLGFRKSFKADKQRNGGGGYVLRFLWLFRKANESGSRICRALLRWYYVIYGLEIPWNTTIGPGLYLGHARDITINPNSVIGSNCNIHKGVTIGKENRGKRKGAPIIGNQVWVGVNATICGHISVGDDVLIAPNSYVNCDIPSHSIVIGNPCKIFPKENATLGYINKIIS